MATNGSTSAFGINSSGQIVGFYAIAARPHGFLLSGGVYTTIDDPLAANGNFAYGINNNSQIVGTLNDGTGNHGFLETTFPNPPPPAGTTADMILRRADGTYEIYDIGNNAILAGYGGPQTYRCLRAISMLAAARCPMEDDVEADQQIALPRCHYQLFQVVLSEGPAAL